jgi:hypothetical protein
VYERLAESVVLFQPAYSTQTDRLFRIHADHRFHFMPINIGAKRRSGFPSNRLIGMPST